MYSLFEQTTIEIATFLSMVLPELSVDWWQKFVLASLNPYQKDKLCSSGNSTLESLDLAALLRILNDNWYHISSNRGLCTDDRHYLKEMSSVRNRWAHPSGLGICRDDQYRDLDTIQRFLSVIGATSGLIDDVKQMKKDLMIELSSVNNSDECTIETPKARFEVGNEVRLKTNPQHQGAIMLITPGDPEDKILVYSSNGKEYFYESQLEIIPEQPPLKQLLIDEFKATISALQIRQPSLNTLYSLNSARIDFIPYQFRPVLKFIKSDRPRLLIADSVGVGKTIEAGLILRELQARRDIQSILIICPKPLIVERKWQTELRRFDERFTQMDSSELKYCLEEYQMDGIWPDKHRKTIVSYSLFDDELLSGSKKKNRVRPGLLDLDPPPRFDMVIVDEAHHIRNDKTANHKAVKFFCDNSEAVIFLTATPIQLGNRDLFVLLNTLRPDLIINEKNYTHMSEPNEFINTAAKVVRYTGDEWQRHASIALNKAAETAWGRSMLTTNPIFVRLQKDLQSIEIDQERRVQMISEIENLHTFNLIINRTRRRDIEAITIRSPETCTVEFTTEQAFIHDELLNIQSQILSIVQSSTPINFMMSTIRRQAASCIFGLVPLLKDILNRHLSELDWDEMAEESPADSMIDDIHEQIDTMIELCGSISNEDPKLDRLRRIIQDKKYLDNNKIMVFSSFRHTLSYLYEHLNKDSIRIAMIHGGTPDDDRRLLRKRFELPKEDPDVIDVMLFSEVGCEGLDYQFCDTMVNYDLPWNPMKIEQRIGRIDRRGQKSPKVFIFNLITPGTIDADIYTRCLMRIGIFENSIGDSEAILGDITTELKHIGENMTLSPEERNARLQQLADNQIRTLQEEERLEQQQHQLFGIDIPKKQTESDIYNASSFWLSSKMLEHMVLTYLRKRMNKETDFILGEKEAKTLRLSHEARTGLLNDYQALKISKNEVGRQWELYLKGGDPLLQVTFNTAFAMDNPSTVLLNPVHPLLKQAAEFLRLNNLAYTMLDVVDATIPAGSYDFVIYKWQMHGLRNDLQLQTICSSNIVGKRITSLLETAVNQEFILKDNLLSEYWEYLDKAHYDLWSKAKEEHQSRVRELVEFRKESLRNTHKARLEYIKDQISKVTDEKIIRMHNASLKNAEADFTRRMQDLEIAVEKADILTDVVVYGVINIMEVSYGS